MDSLVDLLDIRMAADSSKFISSLAVASEDRRRRTGGKSRRRTSLVFKMRRIGYLSSEAATQLRQFPAGNCGLIRRRNTSVSLRRKLIGVDGVERRRTGH